MTSGVVGLLLAGGLGRRMGGVDKSLQMLRGRPLLAHTIERATPQTAALLLNANGDPARFASFGLPVVADSVEGFAGPLAGILTGLDWARANAPDCPWVASFATDAPFIPGDLVPRLLAAVEGQGADIGCAVSGGRTHPVFGLWPVRLADALRRAVVEEEMRKIDRWTARYRVAYAEWAAEPVDPFFNVNTAEELARAEGFRAEAAAAPIEAVNLGIVVERRDSGNPWTDYTWHAVEVIVGGPASREWRLLKEEPGWVRWYAGALELRLHRKETEGYRRNLSSGTPQVYVVLRPGGMGMTPFHVTVCPYEAESYTVSGDEVVDGVAMPPEVAAMVEGFVTRHHVEEPFRKRKKKAKTDGSLAAGNWETGSG